MLDASDIVQVSKYTNESTKNILPNYSKSIIFGYDDFNEKFKLDDNLFLNINNKIINSSEVNKSSQFFTNLFSVKLIETEAKISDASVLKAFKILSKFSLSVQEVKKLLNIDWQSKSKNIRLYNKKFIADVFFLTEKMTMNTDDIYILLENSNGVTSVLSDVKNALFVYGNTYCIIKITSDIQEYQKIKKGEVSIEFSPEYIEELINKYIELNF
tara:strand:- start:1266 stop:1907 length:642 start_codon:yes stop_codon:yes gene_type:complete